MTRGKPPTTGRFDTRAELCEFIWREYLHGPRSASQVAVAARVSPQVVHKILNTKEGWINERTPDPAA